MKRFGITRREFSNSLMAAVAGPIIYRPDRPTSLGGQEPLFSQLKDVKTSKWSIIKTCGWSVAGLGAAQYVCDDLAAQLYIEHPRFCTTTANGLYVRLLPTDGMIVVEQGGAYGTQPDKYQFNDQSAIQSAIDYAQAIGIDQVGFAQSNYNVLVTSRSTDPSLGATDGQGLCVAASQNLKLVGLGPMQTKLLFLSDQGESFDGNIPHVNYQIVNGHPWRGCGIFVDTHRDRMISKTSAIHLENMWLDGGSRRDLATSDPSMLAWDITNKGICVMPDGYGGSVTIVNSAITGWRGETVYCSNDVNAKLTVRNSLFSHSNGQGLNPNSCQVDVDLCEIRNCFVGIEGWTGEAGGRIVRTSIVNCRGLDGTGGAFSLQGGKGGTSSRSAYYCPTQVTPGIDPIGEVDITCRQSGRAMVGWWLKGSLALVDTPLVLGEPMAFNEGSQFLNLSVSLINETNTSSIVMITGGAGVQGDMLTDNCNIKIFMVRPSKEFVTPYQMPVTWYGSLGGNINVWLTDCENNRNAAPMGLVLDSSPNINVMKTGQSKEFQAKQPKFTARGENLKVRRKGRE